MKSICNDIGNIIFDFLSSNYPTLEFSLVYDTDFESEEPVIKILVKNQYLPLEQEIKILREIWDKVDEKYPNEFKRIQIILDYE
ncbi:hypothetical protein [Methanocaldococcus fervens]|nr:hypothetical protein [Methanocaldococcus fervens]